MRRAAAAAFLCGLMFLTVAGCSRNPATSAADRVVYTTETGEKTYGNCQSEDGCTRVSMRWPLVTAAPTEAARDSLGAFVYSVTHAAYDGDSLLASEEDVMMEFIAAYRAFAVSHPDAAAPWHFERRLEVLGDTLGVASMALTEEAFTGGAHPSNLTFLVNFDTHTGQFRRRQDLLLESARARLDSLGERAFRRVRKLDPREDLGAAGFQFPNGRFELNDNLAVTATGLLFFYNEYEIGPHSVGSTQISLPWSEVADCVRPDGPLGNHARRSP